MHGINLGNYIIQTNNVSQSQMLSLNEYLQNKWPLINTKELYVSKIMLTTKNLIVLEVKGDNKTDLLEIKKTLNSICHSFLFHQNYKIAWEPN
jgi:hypothetical protein